MKLQHVLLGLGAMLMLSSLPVHAGPPESDSCALLKPDDLSALFGGAPVAKPIGDSCLWTASGSSKQLNILKYKNTGMAADMAFMTARKNISKSGPVTNETDLGDRAFSRLLPLGVVLLTIKQGQLLQLQLRTEAPGTEKDLDALRSVAKKVVATF